MTMARMRTQVWSCGFVRTALLSVLFTAVLQQRAAIQVGGVTEGEIPGFGSRYVELVYSPEEAVEHTAEFDITFSHDHLQPVS